MKLPDGGAWWRICAVLTSSLVVLHRNLGGGCVGWVGGLFLSEWVGVFRFWFGAWACFPTSLGGHELEKSVVLQEWVEHGFNYKRNFQWYPPARGGLTPSFELI
jgi:hypothetical protein